MTVRLTSTAGAVRERGDSYFDPLHGVHFRADERRYAGGVLPFSQTQSMQESSDECQRRLFTQLPV